MKTPKTSLGSRNLVLFVENESGAIMPMAAGAIVLFLGFSALAIDISRYFDLQTQLQKAADAFALAGAAELNGQSDSETRAQQAVANLAVNANSSVWGPTVTVSSITFYSSLSNDAPATSGFPGTVANDPTQAAYIQVVAAPVSLSAWFAASLIGAPTTLTTSAAAVAGFKQIICQQTPIYVCNGNGSTDMTNPSAMKGREVSLVGAPGTGYAAGNYGFLDIGCGNNTPCLNQALGAYDNGICVLANPVSTTTGQKTATSDYFNTRFDLYRNSANNADTSIYSPDQNIRKGYANSGACNNNNPSWNGLYELPLPDDSNIAGNYGTATIGNGQWQGGYSNYWSMNFPGVTQPNVGQFPTRYDLYNYELTHDRYGNSVAPGAANALVNWKSCGDSACDQKSGEIGAPVCAPASSARANRRILYAGVVDCSKLSGGVNNNVPVLAMVKFLLLRPVCPTASDPTCTGGFGTLVAEYVDLAWANKLNSPLHDIVQLYR